MKSTSARRVALSVVVAMTLTGVAACSSSGGSDGGGKDDGRAAGKGTARVSPIAALRSAEKSTDKADSARVEATTVMGSTMSLKSKGTLAWSDGLNGSLTLTYTGGTASEMMRTQLGTTSMQARYLSDAYYAKMGDKFAAQAGGKHWIRYAYDDLEKLAGSSGAFLGDQMRNTTPNQSVKLLLASGDVKKVGEETVRGVRATHYAGTVEVADLATKNSSLSAGQLAALHRQLEQAGVTTETIDIWVDDQDLLVKKVEKGEMATGELTQTAYYSDYGVKVSTQAPPADDTEDFKALLGKQGGTTS
ncbi:hypothetical protein [Streptomyces griseus]|uniref:hypothetical protein n=1 Tax=Streptomyces griseus TaxID=1911 RepID=UPI00055F4E48|nr:hypothetical protein [Streptomyces griseus]